MAQGPAFGCQRHRPCASLGWTDFFGDHLGPHDANLVPMRIATVHRDRLTAHISNRATDLTLPTL
ncbi:MAG: hypothetical protein E5Y65_02195 [Mesorhizobium sp.]|nr:MAG: hypothetical protein E5Y70_00910 [Mesorhizobium sp.]TIL93834.1 MAG: hypothetical protein E5Y65_02195 [Mesorhizobium sp.]TIM02624.1 MAG: hypothetical protein E5Y64_04135 [Mesorhizobium sp.]